MGKERGVQRKTQDTIVPKRGCGFTTHLSTVDIVHIHAWSLTDSST